MRSFGGLGFRLGYRVASDVVSALRSRSKSGVRWSESTTLTTNRTARMAISEPHVAHVPCTVYTHDKYNGPTMRDSEPADR